MSEKEPHAEFIYTPRKYPGPIALDRADVKRLLQAKEFKIENRKEDEFVIYITPAAAQE
jgi:hypothetical protein